MSRAALPETASVVVVGGGVMGASIGFHLAEAGVQDVLVLERGELASGSTSKAAGGVRAQFSDPLNIALGARSLEAFNDFARRPGGQIDLRTVGYLFLLTSPEQVAEYEASVELQNRMGVATRFLAPDEAARLAPIIATDDVLAATFHAGDGYCTPESVVLGYATAARCLGARVETGVEVTGIDVAGGEITGVVTDAGRVRTPTVVVATGPWAAQVAGMAGVDLPVTPLRRQIVVTEPLAPDVAALAPPTLPMTIDAASTFYLHREGPGMLMGMSYAGEEPGFHLSMDDAWLPDLLATIETRAPALLDVGIAYGWAGLYEMTPDHNALIGESRDVSRLLYATGFSGHGFLQGPAVGEVVRDLVLRREPFVDIAPLSADRFAAGIARPERRVV